MKKLTIVLAVLVVVTGTSAFANTGDKVTKAVQTAFQKNFSGALNVNWEVTDEFYFASFDLNGKTIDAAYNEKGELVGISRKLQLSDLPLNVYQSLKSDYAGYTIVNKVTEILYEGQTFYFATAEGANRILKLKCFSNGQINIEKKIKK
jgi:hypothetical protein